MNTCTCSSCIVVKLKATGVHSLMLFFPITFECPRSNTCIPTLLDSPEFGQKQRKQYMNPKIPTCICRHALLLSCQCRRRPTRPAEDRQNNFTSWKAIRLRKCLGQSILATVGQFTMPVSVLLYSLDTNDQYLLLLSLYVRRIYSRELVDIEERLKDKLREAVCCSTLRCSHVLPMPIARLFTPGLGGWKMDPGSEGHHLHG